jgi:cell division protein FtsA
MVNSFAQFNDLAKSHHKLVVGIDIGTTKIACVVGKINSSGKVEVLAIGKALSEGVRRGVVMNIDQTVSAIKEAVAKVEAQCDIKVKKVNVGIAGQHIKSIQQPGIYTRKDSENEISSDDVKALRDDMMKIHVPAGESIIHVIPQEYTVDMESGIKDPVGMAGTRLQANFHIITGSMPAIRNIYRCVELAGLEVGELTLEPLASSASVLTEEEKEAGVALVDIGGGTTDIAIFHDGLIRHTAVIPFGGNVITDDIRNGCNILTKYAEQLKTAYGSALVSETKNAKVVVSGLRGHAPKEITLSFLSGIIESRMKEILELVHFEIVRSQYVRKLIGGIVLTGGGSQLKHIRQLVEFTTGLSCRIGAPTEHVVNFPNMDELVPALATGLGLVITGEERAGEAYINPVVLVEDDVEQNRTVEPPVLDELPSELNLKNMSFAEMLGVISESDISNSEKVEAPNIPESEKIQTPSHEEFHYTEQPEQKDNVDQENLSSNTTASVDTKVGSKNRIDILGWLKNYLEQDDATK